MVLTQFLLALPQLEAVEALTEMNQQVSMADLAVGLVVQGLGLLRAVMALLVKETMVESISRVVDKETKAAAGAALESQETQMPRAQAEMG